MASLRPLCRLRAILTLQSRTATTVTRSFRSLAHPLVTTPSLRQEVLEIGKSPRRGMFIQTDSTPNPLAIKFVPGKDVLGEGVTAMQFSSFREAQVSPLARKLFQIEGVTAVFLGSDFLSVTIDEEQTQWMLAKPSIFSAIMDFYASGDPVVSEGAEAEEDTCTIYDDDDEVVALIKELLETRIRPAVQQDGGDIKYCGFDEETGVVSVQLQGACVGCSSASVTLKHGVENMLMHYIPEVKAVEEILDEVQTVGEQQLAELEAKLAEARAKRENKDL